MDSTLILGKILAIYLIIISVIFLLRGKALKQHFLAMASKPELMMFSGILALIFGAVVITLHNDWSFGWPLIITLLGWLMIFQGIVRLSAPQWVGNKATKFLQGKGMQISVVITLVVGIILAYFSIVQPMLA